MDETAIRTLSDMGAAETSLRDWIAANAKRHPDKIFIESVDQEKSITYGQFRDIAASISA